MVYICNTWKLTLSDFCVKGASIDVIGGSRSAPDIASETKACEMEAFGGTEGAPSSLSVRDRQRAALEEMLGACGGGAGDGEEVWKVLVYDAAAREIIAPLLRVADLRKMGVTLHMMLHANRQPIPDVPAVYFVAPTAENVRRVCADCARGMYASVWLNFTSRLPRELLEGLADGVVSARPEAAGSIARVFDMYTEFLTLENNLFSLNLPGAYAALNAAKVSSAEIELQVGRIVDSLFCVVVTLGAVPVIRAQRKGPAELVAHLLEKRIREHLIGRNNVFAESAGSFTAGVGARPLLVIVDRGIDLPVMLHHTWTYQALAHDTLSLNLNRVTVPVRDPDGSAATSKKRTFDLDKSDTFWGANAGLPFPMVAEAVEGALQAYKDEVAELNRSAGAVGDGAMTLDQLAASASEGPTAGRLAAAISSIPELTKKKKMIDLHTNIATALLDQIKDRGLDGFFQVEEELLARPSTFDVERILALMRDMRGLTTDKLRLFLMYYLCVDSASTDDLSKCTSALETAGCSDLRAFTYLKSIKAFTKSMASVPVAPLASSSSIGSGYAASVMDTLSHVANNVNKLIISADKALAAARVMQTLMDQKGDAEVLEGYATLDPKAPKGSAISAVAKRPFREAVLFVVGPGNYVEYQNCQDHVCSVLKQDGGKSQHVPNGKTLIYGATELCTGSEFLEQLQLNGGPKPSPEPQGA